MNPLNEAQALIKQVDQANKYRLQMAINTLRYAHSIKDAAVIADSESFLSALVDEIRGAEILEVEG